MARPLKLTAETHALIVKYVRSGMFDYVAAGAAGVHVKQFYVWMQRGDRPGAPKVFREFRKDVLRARQEARGIAEARVFQDNAFNWLRYGPGRGRPGEPGWTESSTLAITGARSGDPLEIVIREVVTGHVDADDRTASASAPPGSTNGDRRRTPL